MYGTADDPQPEELEYRRATAAHAAEWSTPRSKLLLTLRALSDKELQPEEAASANLILFGTKETNSVIANLSAQLPIALQAGAADYGLLYIYPLGSRYVVINSGLPWWRRADQFTRPTMILAPPQLRPLMTFKTWLSSRAASTTSLWRLVSIEAGNCRLKRWNGSGKPVYWMYGSERTTLRHGARRVRASGP
ncbi:MAG: hypothetical protein WKF37_07225 [Bryobacteraceae bacterium]